MQSKKLVSALVLALLLSVAGSAGAVVWTVSIPGDLQPTIDAASAGDTILVLPETYNEALVIDSKPRLHIIAVDLLGSAVLPIAGQQIGVGPIFTTNTVIDGTGLGTDCVRVIDSHNVVIEGLVLVGCEDNAFVIQGTGPPIRNVRVSANWIQWPVGAAFFVENGRNVQILDNYAEGSSAPGTLGVVLSNTRRSLVSDNILPGYANAALWIQASSRRNHVFNNEAKNNVVGIRDAGRRSRIEWNNVEGNILWGIEVASTSLFADIASNTTGGALNYFWGGVGTEGIPFNN